MQNFTFITFIVSKKIATLLFFLATSDNQPAGGSPHKNNNKQKNTTTTTKKQQQKKKPNNKQTPDTVEMNASQNATFPWESACEKFTSDQPNISAYFLGHNWLIHAGTKRIGS